MSVSSLTLQSVRATEARTDCHVSLSCISASFTISTNIIAEIAYAYCIYYSLSKCMYKHRCIFLHAIQCLQNIFCNIWSCSLLNCSQRLEWGQLQILENIYRNIQPVNIDDFTDRTSNIYSEAICEIICTGLCSLQGVM